MKTFFVIASLAMFLLALRKDVIKGLSVAVTLSVVVPHDFGFSFPGVPDLTLGRMMIICLIPYLLKGLAQGGGWRNVPMSKPLCFLTLTQIVSLSFSITKGNSLNYCISFVFEIVIFYALLSLSLKSWDDVIRLVKAACLGIFIVAIVGSIEKYTGLNIYKHYLFYKNSSRMDITSTFSHRITFGYAMAMGVPLMLAVLEFTRKSRIYSWVSLLLTIAACYFSTSRGPWMGLGIGIAALISFSGRRCLMRLRWVIGLTLAVLILRPGVREGIFELGKETFQTDTLKGRSYDYRWKLWRVAFSEISKSPIRLVFGYGGLSTESMDLSEYFEHESGGTATVLGFTSWDNNFASDLIEFGFSGLLLGLFVYFLLIRMLVDEWRLHSGEKRYLIAGVIASALVYLFANSNVYIFSPQLKYLFWTLAGVGAAAQRLRAPEFVVDWVPNASASESSLLV